MFNSTVLEIGIGLIFVYLLLGLVVTAVNEMIATIFRSRARDLKRGIANLLDGESHYPDRWWWDGPKWVWQRITGRESRRPTPPWTAKFLDHPLINALSKTKTSPSYIPSQVFATVLMHLAGQQPSVQPTAKNACDSTPPAGLPLDGLASFDQIHATVDRIKNQRLRAALLPLVEEARTDLSHGVAAVTKFNKQVEVWFDHSMDRVSGWYKRRTQGFLLGIALLATVLLNVDSIAICRALSHNDALRTAVVDSAKQYTESAARKPVNESVSTPATTQSAASQPSTAQPSIDESYQRLRKQIDELNSLSLPIGWTLSDKPSKDSTDPPSDTKPGKSANFADNDLRLFLGQNWIAIVTKIGGLLLTAFAASLGAPFWFDTLNKVISIRSTGKPPEERPKDPKVVLQPQRP